MASSSRILRQFALRSSFLKHQGILTMSTSISPMAATGATEAFPVAASITQNLTAEFEPTHLEVINESHKHKVPKNSETHFKVVVVSEKFNDVTSLIKRHRLINGALAKELEGPVHALSIVAKSPLQWEEMVASGKKIQPSPNCRGGDGTFQNS